jgi:hypothetical protein
MAGVLLVLLAGCGAGPVSTQPPRPSGAAAAACRALVDDLPDTVQNQDARPVEPPDALAAAWGDPPILLRCGVKRPARLRPSSPCVEIDGVGWFPQRAARGYVFTTVGRTANVEVLVPEAYQPAAEPLVDLADAIRRHIPERQPCR